MTITASETVLDARGLRVRYGSREVVSDVSLTVRRGEVLGLIGESGSGKTTIARSILGSVPVDTGSLTVDGVRVESLTGPELRRFRREGRAQYVFQDPLRSLDGRFTALRSAAEGARQTYGRTDADAHARTALRAVRLSDDLWTRVPSALSGGQRQRVAIARALAVDPSLLVCDEPVSALDASSRVEVVTALRRTAEAGTGMLVISHDLSSLAALADRLAVLDQGTVVEEGTVAGVLGDPQHPYTRRLVAAVPTIASAPTRTFDVAADPRLSRRLSSAA